MQFVLEKWGVERWEITLPYKGPLHNNALVFNRECQNPGKFWLKGNYQMYFWRMIYTNTVTQLKENFQYLGQQLFQREPLLYYFLSTFCN